MKFPPKSLPLLIVTSAAVLACESTCRAAAAGPAAEYLSDQLADRIVTSSQGWGALGLNTAVQPPGRPAAPLRIQDHSYRKGLGHHAPGEILVDLGGQFLSFEADLGIQWQGGGTKASVVFQVFVDDRKVLDTGTVHESDPPRSIQIPLENAQELKLVATDAGDGITCDCANWAEARLTRNPEARAAPVRSVNVAPFGRILSWDPAKRTGTRASRIQEFPAADIAPEKELKADADGAYVIPDWNGTGCLGVQWYESRTLREVALEFADGSGIPPADSITLEVWVGESPWQGSWERAKATPETQGNRLSWRLDVLGAARPTTRVRWCLASAGKTHRVKSIAAFTRARWKPVEVLVSAAETAAPARIAVELYNGVWDEPASVSEYRREWDARQPLTLRLLTSVPRSDKTDRTVLRFAAPAPGFAVAVEDVLRHGSISYEGINIALAGRTPPPPAEEAPLQSMLDQVRKHPDQTLESALAVTHNPIQDLGPMMLSLACDNRKVVADREGTVRFDAQDGLADPPREIPDQWQLHVWTGQPGERGRTRRLHGGWLPMPEMITRDGALVTTERVFVAPVGEAMPDLPAWVRARAVGIVETVFRNEGNENVQTKLVLGITGKTAVPIEDGPAPELALMTSRGRILAVVDARSAGPLRSAHLGEDFILRGTLPPSGEARCTVLIPLWKLAPGDVSTLASTTSTQWEEQTRAYWNACLESAMHVEVPDAFLTNVLRASQVHCLLAARSEAGGRRVAAWISSDRYGPLESEAQAVIRGMDLFGQTEFARRALEFFLHRYDSRGFLTTSYTLIGAGENLWTLAEHADRTRDRAWLDQIAPVLVRACDGIVTQRSKTKRTDIHGAPVPEYGLMPPGVSADWNRFAYRFFNDAQYCAGLTEGARVLTEMGHPRGSALAEDAKAYRRDLLAAYRWTQARSPVVWLGNGAWGPAQPSLLDSFGRVEEFLPGEDGNRSWAYSIELGAHHLAALGILNPASAEVSAMLEFLENIAFLRTGMGDYPEAQNRRDPFNMGGFAKVQPFYARVADIYAQRDEVKPFLRAYFNALASLVSRENLSLWEHFHNQGGWNKTHETGWFLCQSRMMLVQERGAELWLAPMLTDRWLQEGKTVIVRNAPTRFGKVGYTIRPGAGLRSIDVEVLPPPAAEGLSRMVVRLRHPEGKAMRAVTVSGRPHTAFDAKAQTISLTPATTPVSLHVDY